MSPHNPIHDIHYDLCECGREKRRVSELCRDCRIAENALRRDMGWRPQGRGRHVVVCCGGYSNPNPDAEFGYDLLVADEQRGIVVKRRKASPANVARVREEFIVEAKRLNLLDREYEARVAKARV